MISWDVFLGIFVRGAMLMLAGLGLESAAVTSCLDHWNKRFFISFFSVLLPYTALSLFYANPSLTTLMKIAYYLESLLSTIPFPMLSVYLLHCCGEQWWSSPLFRAILVLGGAYFVLLNAAQFTTLFYYVDSNGGLKLGPGYQLLVMIVIAMLLLLVAATIRRRRYLSRHYYRAFQVCLYPVTLALAVHMFVPVFLLLDVGLVASAYSMYRIIESASVEQYLRQQREIASQRASIAVLQLRPHFIYNTMTSIYYLCDQDPELAKQMTMDFTTYLRKNFTAIASEDPIPVSEELEHTRAYLAVERAQFEDRLLVDFDTPHIRFRVPPLTLQPIVENAVKHGMDPDAGPMHVWIRTREVDACSEIIVEDDGLGFDPAVADRPHTALANIRQRLEMMCGGKLDITSREGGGSVVKVTIPA